MASEALLRGVAFAGSVFGAGQQMPSARKIAKRGSAVSGHLADTEDGVARSSARRSSEGRQGQNSLPGSLATAASSEPGSKPLRSYMLQVEDLEDEDVEYTPTSNPLSTPFATSPNTISSAAHSRRQQRQQQLARVSSDSALLHKQVHFEDEPEGRKKATEVQAVSGRVPGRGRVRGFVKDLRNALGLKVKDHAIVAETSAGGNLQQGSRQERLDWVLLMESVICIALLCLGGNTRYEQGWMQLGTNVVVVGLTGHLLVHFGTSLKMRCLHAAYATSSVLGNIQGSQFSKGDSGFDE